MNVRVWVSCNVWVSERVMKWTNWLRLNQLCVLRNAQSHMMYRYLLLPSASLYNRAKHRQYLRYGGWFQGFTFWLYFVCFLILLIEYIIYSIQHFHSYNGKPVLVLSWQMFVYLNYAVVSWFEMPSKWHVLSRLYYIEPVLIVSE